MPAARGSELGSRQEVEIAKLQEISDVIRAERESLAGRIVEQHDETRAGMCKPCCPEGHEKSVRDVGYHLSYLAEALDASDPSLFAEYVAWAKVLFAGLGFSEDVLATTLACTRQVLKDRFSPGCHTAIDRFLDAGVRSAAETASSSPTYLQGDAPLDALAQHYLEALLDGRRNAASRMILDAVDEGTPVREIYLHVFQPVQREIGRLWQTNQISVAREHYCTAATQLVMSRLYPRIFATKRTGYQMVATCVGGELHEIGVRMVADFFEMEGWDTYYLGANTPTESILRTVDERQPDVLGVSATITTHVGDVRGLIQRVRGSEAGEGVKIMVGGYPFNTARDLWRRIGADGYAPNAQEATAVAHRWVSES